MRGRLASIAFGLFLAVQIVGVKLLIESLESSAFDRCIPDPGMPPLPKAGSYIPHSHARHANAGSETVEDYLRAYEAGGGSADTHYKHDVEQNDPLVHHEATGSGGTAPRRLGEAKGEDPYFSAPVNVLGDKEWLTTTTADACRADTAAPFILTKLNFLVTAALVIALIIGVARIKWIGRRVERGATLKRKRNADIYELVDAASRRVKLRYKAIVIHKCPSLNVSPTITRTRGTVRLTLPTGASMLFDTEPRTLEAMLVHEFAHIANGDGAAWLLADVCRVFFRDYRLSMRAVAYIAFSIVGLSAGNLFHGVSVHTLAFGVLYAAAFVVPSSMALIGIARVARYWRTESEYQADDAAALACGAAAVCDAIDKASKPLPASTDEKPLLARLAAYFDRRLFSDIHGDAQLRKMRLAPQLIKEQRPLPAKEITDAS